MHNKTNRWKGLDWKMATVLALSCTALEPSGRRKRREDGVEVASRLLSHTTHTPGGFSLKTAHRNGAVHRAISPQHPFAERSWTGRQSMQSSTCSSRASCNLSSMFPASCAVSREPLAIPASIFLASSGTQPSLFGPSIACRIACLAYTMYRAAWTEGG